MGERLSVVVREPEIRAVLGFGIRVWGSGFRDEGLGFRD